LLREALRARRRSLSPARQRQAGVSLLHVLSGHQIWNRSRRLAAYCACDGEIDPRPLVERAWQQGRQVFLPVVNRLNHKLDFYRWDENTSLIRNRYGIEEPCTGAASYKAAPWTLDLVLMPLTGFDAACRRLGMGGGFYDRTFADTQTGMARRKPWLVGMAHACQRVERVPTDDHDLSLSLVATDAGCWSAQTAPSRGSRAVSG